MSALELPEIAPASLSGRSGRLYRRPPGPVWPPRLGAADMPLGRRPHHRNQGAHATPIGNAILLWSDVTAARHQFARLQRSHPAVGRRLRLFRRQDRFLTGNALYAQLAGMPLAELSGRPSRRIITRWRIAAASRWMCTPEEWVQRRLRGHRATTSADTLQTAARHRFSGARPRHARWRPRRGLHRHHRKDPRRKRAGPDAIGAGDSRDEAHRQTGYLADLTKRLTSPPPQADSAKTMLLRTMSHELKTPLNAILGFPT